MPGLGALPGSHIPVLQMEKLSLSLNLGEGQKGMLLLAGDNHRGLQEVSDMNLKGKFE